MHEKLTQRFKGCRAKHEYHTRKSEHAHSILKTIFADPHHALKERGAQRKRRNYKCWDKHKERNPQRLLYYVL
jgi:hypothetical protein